MTFNFLHFALIIGPACGLSWSTAWLVCRNSKPPLDDLDHLTAMLGVVSAAILIVFI